MKNPTKLLSALAACTAMSVFGAAQAYELKTVFKTEHFAVNQVILDQGETLDAPTQSSITGDVQTKNRLSRLYQSSTVVFPAGSQGFAGKFNTPIEGVLSISNYNSGKDRIYFNRSSKFLTEGGLSISYPQLQEMINQKVLHPLIDELSKLPVVLTDIPVSVTGTDKTIGAFFVTSVSQGAVLDMRIDDSVYYKPEQYMQLHNKCKINVMLLTDRLYTDEIPMFISGRASMNFIACDEPERKSEGDGKRLNPYLSKEEQEAQ